jgi:copper chaperone CopZ
MDYITCDGCEKQVENCISEGNCAKDSTISLDSIIKDKKYRDENPIMLPEVPKEIITEPSVPYEGGHHPNGCSYCKARFGSEVCLADIEETTDIVVLVTWECKICGHNHAFELPSSQEARFREDPPCLNNLIV